MICSLLQMVLSGILCTKKILSWTMRQYWEKRIANFGFTWSYHSDSLEDMSWEIGEYNLMTFLRVPVFIRKTSRVFIDTLC
jgi:hypothetical protein